MRYNCIHYDCQPERFYEMPIEATYHFDVEEIQVRFCKIFNPGDKIHLCSKHAHILYRECYDESLNYLKFSQYY